ncbi:MAG: DUF4453 domain-containing protein [Paracoccaceae bacterium]
MNKVWTLLVMVLGATPAMADICEDHWFTRNLIIDRAGYCFGSTLGKAVFDNSDCISKQVSLTPEAARQVAEIRAEEQRLQCKIDTSARTLDLEDMRIRRKLSDLPIRDEFESGCIGWQAGVTALYAGWDQTTTVVGRIQDGDDVLYSHAYREGWAYVTVRAPGWGALKSAGWLGRETSEKSCRQWAG